MVKVKGLRMDMYNMGSGESEKRELTFDEVRGLYGPPASLGSEEQRIALDAQMESDGVYSLIQHAANLGQLSVPQFMGYGALQGLAQNALIRACIETVSDDMVREWVSLKDEGGNAPKDAIERLDTAMRSFNLRQVFREALEYVGYEGGALIFIDTGAGVEELETLLNHSEYSKELVNNKIKGFTVIDPVNITPGTYNSLYPMKPDYYKPEYWYILGTKVHHSRVIRLVSNEVPTLLKPAYNFFGLAQAQILYDYVIHFQKNRVAVSDLLNKFSLKILKTDIGDVLYQRGGTGELDARINFMINSIDNNGIWVLDRDTEEVVKLETPLSGVTEIVRQSFEFIAAINRTPAVKLLGVSPSGFNATGESDIRNYYDHISSQANKVLRPALETVLRLLQLHCFGTVYEGIGFDFRPLGQEDMAALALTRKTKVETLVMALDAGFIAQDEGRAILATDADSGFDIPPEMPPSSTVDEEEGLAYE